MRIMHFLARIIALFVSNLIGMLVASYFVAGFELVLAPKPLLTVVGLLTAINLFVKPILKLLLSPLILLTLGLFALVINAALLYALDFFVEGLTIRGLSALLYATLIITFVNAAFHVSTRRLR